MAANTGAYAGKIGWTVGRADWLDNPASKVNRYWRAMEFGQTYEGLILVGLWGDRSGGSRNTTRILRTGGPLTAPEPGLDTQKFVPFGVGSSPEWAIRRAKFAFWYFITKGKMGKPTDGDLSILHGATPRDNRAIFHWILTKAPLEKIPFVSARAMHAVIAHEYYTGTVLRFKPMEVQKVILKEEASTLLSGVFSGAKARAAIGGMGNQGPRAAGPREVSPAQGAKYFGSRVGQVTIISSAAQQSLLRTANGQWPAGLWQQMLIKVNARVAKEFQDAVVAAMEKDPHLRPATGDLIRATLDDRNRYPV